MSPEERQKALDNISSEDLEKIQKHQASTKGALTVDNEWLLLTEFALKFGWQAYLDAKNDARDDNGNLIVSSAEMMTLIEASRRLKYRDMFQDAQTSFIGSASSKSKKPTQTFNSLTNNIVKKTKADE